MYMKLRCHILSGIVIMCPLLLHAIDGASAYNFLNTPSSSRVYGLGGVNISLVDDDISVTEQNPALLGPEVEKQLALNYMRYIGGSNFAGVRYGMAATERSAWSAAIQYFGYGDFKASDPSGNITGDFSAHDMYFAGTYSHDITDRLRGGISIKGIYSSYEEYSAFAVAADLGLNYFDGDNDLSLSMVVANLGGQIKRFNDTYDCLPIDVRLGVSKGFENLRFSVTAWNLTKWKLPYYETGDGTVSESPTVKESFSSNLFRHLVFSAEFIPSDRFYIGIGYNYKTRTDMSTYKRSFLSGFSACVGLNVKNFAVGVALSQPHTGATTIMLNLSTKLYEF